MMAQSVKLWSKDEVYQLFSKLGRRDIAEAMRKSEVTGTLLLELEGLDEEGTVSLSDSQLHFVLNILSYMTGRHI
jgi:hypothetical protein